MNTQVLIAMTASISSLIVAMISLINSVISNRQSARSTRMIEALRFELEVRKSTQRMSDDYLLQSLESLSILIQAIQRTKDVLQVIISDVDSSVDSESAIEDIVEAREQLFKCFGEQLPNLREGEAHGAHAAKNKALDIETLLRKDLQGKSFASEWSASQKLALLELRNDLTDAQNLLRDSRSAQMMKRLEAL